MTLVGTIVVGLALLIGALNGARRGAVREGLALIGVLLGALLVTLWVERWGVAVSGRTGWTPGTGRWIAAMGLLWVTALFAGYAAGSLVAPAPGSLPRSRRAGGALLGLINWGLLTGLSLRYTQQYFFGETAATRKMTWIRSAIASNFLLDRFDLILLGAAWTVAVVALAITLFRLLGRLVASRSAPAPLKPSGQSPPPTPRPAPDSPLFSDSAPTQRTPTAPGMERSFLDKPRTPSGGPG